MASVRFRLQKLLIIWLQLLPIFFNREARYLLLITSAPLPSIQVLLSQCLKGAPPLTIFGSGFPRDDNISKVCFLTKLY